MRTGVCGGRQAHPSYIAAMVVISYAGLGYANQHVLERYDVMKTLNSHLLFYPLVEI